MMHTVQILKKKLEHEKSRISLWHHEEDGEEDKDIGEGENKGLVY